MLFKSTLKQLYEVIPGYFNSDVTLRIAKEYNPNYVVYPHTTELKGRIELTVYFTRDLRIHACVASSDGRKRISVFAFPRTLPQSFDINILGEKNR